MLEVSENMFAMFKILESGTEEAHKLITRTKNIEAKNTENHYMTAMLHGSWHKSQLWRLLNAYNSDFRSRIQE